MNLEDGVAVAQRVDEEGRDVVFNAAYDTFRNQLMELCWRITGNSADAEDAFHDTMMNVYRGLSEFRGQSKFSTWIYRVAVRSSLRVRARRKNAHIELPPDICSTDSNPALDDKEELAKILSAIQTLPEESRTVLHLFALKQLGHAEIADVLGIPVGTVWSRLHRARQRLRQKLRVIREPQLVKPQGSR